MDNQYVSPEVEKFMYFEKLFFKIQLTMFGIGMFLLFFLTAIVNQIRNVNQFFIFVFYFGMILPGVQLILSIVRIIKYIAKISKLEGEKSIWRSALSFVFSPLTFGIFYLIFIILVFASCAASV